MILRKKMLVVILVLLIGLVLVAVLIVESQRNQNTVRRLYENYKKEYIDPVSFRVIDKQKDGITTSEGQSYGMLMSMWMDDRSTFDNVWKWTQDNLQKPNTNSFSWLWGKNSKGEYGVIKEQGGESVATDGDIDIAFALVKASKKWNEQKYADSAKKIANDIWTNEVIITKNGKYILAANDSEKKYQKAQILVNPSYYNPAAFSEFSKLNPEVNWGRLIDDGYELLDKSSSSNLGNSKSVYLPPDWINVDYENTNISPTNNPSFGTTYGFDAIRIPWRIALDNELNQNPKALEYLEKMNFLKKDWNDKNLLYGVYNHDGTVSGKYETKLMYATSLGYFKNYEGGIANQIVGQKLSPIKIFEPQMSYYDNSWVFFGLALHYGYLT